MGARHWWLTPVILTTGEAEFTRIEIPGQSRKIVLKTLSSKYPTQKRAGRVAQVVEHLLSKCEALSSNSTTTEKKV
jgi:hypothetical protein